MTDDDALIDLDQAAKLIPGFDAEALKRLFRRGKLTCFQPGKRLLTTKRLVMEAVKVNCRATPVGTPLAQAGRPDASSTEIASAALASELERLRAKGDTKRSSSALDLVLSQLPTKRKKRSPQ